MKNICMFRITMKVDGERVIRGMYFFESEMRRYFRENQMDVKRPHNTYRMEQYNVYTQRWNKIY